MEEEGKSLEGKFNTGGMKVFHSTEVESAVTRI